MADVTNTFRVVLMMDPEAVKEIDAIGQERERSRSYIIREAVNEYLKKGKGE